MITIPEMVVIQPGAFLMGSPKNEKGRYNDEGPQHQVTIGYRFAIGRYPVTFAEYDHFWAAPKWQTLDDESWGRGRRPVINISWYDAQAYCEWLAKETGQPYRLPTEAEWEYACRAGTTTPYSFGDSITDKDANFGGKLGRTTEVGSYPTNPWELYDMHGNVWEWVEDISHENYRRAPADGLAWTDSEGKESPHFRIFRGGSWVSDPEDCRSAFRNWARPGYRDYYLGFRVARTIGE